MITWEPGQIILDEYLIERELGRGGMGRVWLCKSQSTGRQFAVKQSILTDEKSRQAFLVELQTWIDLPEHPNIVPCRFFRTVGDEIVIFADFIEGGSLAEWIAKHKLTTVEQILDVAIQFAWGLHAIHERGLIHQDVKPGNVLMTSDGVPMVADFGLARARQASANGGLKYQEQSAGVHSVLVSGAGRMTKQYASPEQIAGQPLSRKTDIWSWGVSVLDMFDGGVSCPNGGQLAGAMLDAILDSGRPEDGLPTMPYLITTILQRCFSKNLSQRAEHIEAVAKEFELAYENICGQTYARSQPKISTPDKRDSFRDKYYICGQCRNPFDWLVMACRASGLNPTDVTTQYRSSVAYTRTASRLSDLAVYEEALRIFRLSEDHGQSTVGLSMAEVHLDISQLMALVGNVQGALVSIDKAINILRNITGVKCGSEYVKYSLCRALNVKGNQLFKAGKYGSACQHYADSLAILSELCVNCDKHAFRIAAANAYNGQAAVNYAVGNNDDVVDISNKVIALCCDNVDGDEGGGSRCEVKREYQKELALALLNKGLSQIALNHAQSAYETLRECDRILSSMIKLVDAMLVVPHLAHCCMNQGLALVELGHLDRAIEIYGRSISYYRELVAARDHGEYSYELALAICNMAYALGLKGECSVSLRHFDESVLILRRLVEVEGRKEYAHFLAQVLSRKSQSHVILNDLVGAVKINSDVVGIYGRLVQVEGRLDLAGDLAVAILNGYSCQLWLGNSNNVSMPIIKKYYNILTTEADSRKRVDLINYKQIYLDVFGDMLK